ncbi:hypothetical protein I4U23_031208 [Adineta vaga]|nr:hypothetical protein I4U23_031208 [Adineta vaga]
MKKTSKDCYYIYKNQSEKIKRKSDKTIKEIRMIPVYFLILPSSCDFGPPDTIIPNESDQIILQGTIKDRNDHEKIQLAWANNEVLRSPPMYRYNRYLRRTYYYFDEFDSHGNIIRYLFCGEYPYILSILDQLTKSGQISLTQKYDEYLRFCSMLQRILQFNHLSDSIKLIYFNDNDGIDTIDCVFCFSQIESMILNNANNRVSLFYSNQIQENPSAMIFINELKKQLENEGYQINDTNSTLNLLNITDQVLFICNEDPTNNINKLIIQYVENKTCQTNVFRDIFILFNNTIQYFSCRFVQTIPYITFNLSEMKCKLNNNELKELIFYLKNMNILSKSYTHHFQDMNQFLDEHSSQCTSVGTGCAAAFYFNYAKLLSPVRDHKYRVESIRKEIVNENRSKFLSKWVFVLPYVITDTSQIFSNVMLLNEDDQNKIGFQLKICKQ